MKLVRTILFFLFAAFVFTTCKKKSSSSPEPNPPPVDHFFAKGADISWLTQMEANGIKFYNSSGTEQDCMLILEKSWYECNPAEGLGKSI